MARFFPYEPAEPVLQDTILAFNAFREAALGIGVVVEPDPKGPVNQIVTLVQGKRRIKSALWRVPAGADVRVVRETGGYTIADLEALRGGFLQRMLEESGELPPRRPMGWYVEIDGHTVLAATDSEMRPRHPVQPVPWRQEATQRLKTMSRGWARNVGDAIVRRFGYLHESEARDW